MAYRLVNKHRMLQPWKCVICEKPPAGRVVDTGSANDNLPVSHQLRGRKYLCENCTEKAGKALGMPTQTTYETQLQATIDARNERDKAQALVESLSEALLRLGRGEQVDEVALEE